MTPATLPDTIPIELDTISGTVTDNDVEDTWYVSKQYYMLTKMKMYKNWGNTSGFEVTYEPYPSSEFSGWPTETHLFGNIHLNGIYVEEITFSQDLEQIEICLDNWTVYNKHDIEGFWFLEYNKDYRYLGPSCHPIWNTVVDLSGYRLIGFKVIESDVNENWRNIKTITPIVDSLPVLSCTDNTLSIEPIGTILAFIDDDPTIYSIYSSSSSNQYYNYPDDSSPCGTKTYTFTPTPSFATTSGNVITV